MNRSGGYVILEVPLVQCEQPTNVSPNNACQGGMNLEGSQRSTWFTASHQTS